MRRKSHRAYSSANSDAFVFEVDSIEDSARESNKESLSSKKTEKYLSDDVFSERSEPAFINKKKRRTKKKVKKAKKVNLPPASLEHREEKSVLQDNTVGTTLSANATPSSTDAELPPTASINNVNGSLEKGIRKHKTARRRRLQKQDINLVDPSNIFPKDSTTEEELCTKRESFSVTPSPRKKSLKRASKAISMETIELTDSDSSPRKLTHSTFDKNSQNISASFNGDEMPAVGFNASNENENLNTTFTTDADGDRKSSFENSFNFTKHRATSEEVLDHLNITRRDSRKSSFKKSSRGLKYSTGSESEDPKHNFVTVRKHCQSMIHFDELYTIGDFVNERKSSLRKFKNSENLNEQEKILSLVADKMSSDSTSESPAAKRASTQKPSPKKSILKKSIGPSRRDTFEIAESFCEGLEAVKSPCALTEATPNKLSKSYQDIVDFVSYTPKNKLDHMIIETGTRESVLIGDTFLEQTRRLTRMNTFTKDEEVGPPPQPEVRKSARKRWTPARKIEFQNDIFNNTRNKSVTFYDSDLVPTKSEEQPTTTNKAKGKKSVKIETPLNTPKKGLRSPLVARKTPKPTFAAADQSRQIEFQNITNSILNKTATDNKENRKKSVRINSPVNTPKMKLHSPLVARKTPKPVFSRADDSVLAEDLKFESPDNLKGAKEQATPNKAKVRTPVRGLASPLSTPKMRMHAPLAFPPADNSILSGNCAFTYLSSTSTPYPTKKEVPLLKKVLTNEKSKVEDTSNKPSSRVKMPNFRKIHERQFEKMEDIKELQQRKALRAQFLMSGCKAIPNTIIPQNVEKESSKKMLFQPLKAGNQTDPSSKIKTSKPLQHMLNKRASLEKKKREEKKKIDFKSKLPVSNKPLVASKGTPTPHPKKIASPVKKNVEPKVVTRYGFKLPLRQSLNKEDQIKAVTTKSKPAVNRVERNRTQINTVRTNRRFELLMKMRANKK